MLVFNDPIQVFNQTSENRGAVAVFKYLPLIQEAQAVKVVGATALTNLEIVCLIEDISENSETTCLVEILAIGHRLTGRAAIIGTHVKTQCGAMISAQVTDMNTSLVISIFKSPLNFGELNILGVSKTERINIAIRSDQTAHPGNIEIFQKNGGSQY